ncbi:acyl carrier protein [Treponema peruense]|uniref:Acyl carrier protein n=1 Tax=Treponema peruense TaxID=2787628 RepID=A0A7T3RFK4_9SPIR|nr:acyl carrier protein [Treponema peruense]QQA02118.1 acyl carrier protein [Treponema peruense]
MEKPEILKEMQDIFIDVLDNDEIVLTEDTSAEDIEEWDSLSHIQLVVGIEKHFNIKLTSKEIMECSNVGDMADCIKGKLA